MEEFELEKILWTEKDFRDMGWHDCRLYGVSFDHKNYSLILDIDYIFKRTDYDESNAEKVFWISPCYLIFENYYNVRIDLDLTNIADIIIGDLLQDNPVLTPNGKLTQWRYQVQTNVGDITLYATGYRQIVRESPLCVNTQDLNRGVTPTI